MGVEQPPSVRPCAPESPEETRIEMPRTPAAAKPWLVVVTYAAEPLLPILHGPVASIAVWVRLGSYKDGNMVRDEGRA